MLSLSKPNAGMPPAKKAALIALLLAIIALGFFLGAFLNRRLQDKTFNATFVSNIPVNRQSA